MRQTFWLFMAVLCMVAMFPALYTGMLLAAELNSFLWFPVPCWVCLGLMVGCCKWAERLDYLEIARLCRGCA